MYHAKAYRVVQLDARGPWEASPRRTVVEVTGEEWLPDTFAVVIRQFAGAGSNPGITVTFEYQTRGQWVVMSEDEVSEFINNV